MTTQPLVGPAFGSTTTTIRHAVAVLVIVAAHRAGLRDRSGDHQHELGRHPHCTPSPIRRRPPPHVSTSCTFGRPC